MNNAFYLINKIKQQIPYGILAKAFKPEFPIGTIPVSIDHIIKKQILNDWVLQDTNVVSGIESVVDISGIYPQSVNLGQVYDIGYGPTAGKDIMSVLSVGYGVNAITVGSPSIASSYSEPYVASTSRIEIVGQNVVYMEGYISLTLSNLRCILSNDKDFANIPTKTLTQLSKMVILATKAYIYNNLRLELYNAQVQNGVDLGAMMSVIDTYSDAQSMYDEMLESWFVISALGDKVTRTRLIRMSMPR